MFQEFVTYTYEEEESWSRVNQTVFRMYGAKPYQFEPTYLTVINQEKNQHKKKKEALLYYTS